MPRLTLVMLAAAAAATTAACGAPAQSSPEGLINAIAEAAPLGRGDVERRLGQLDCRQSGSNLNCEGKTARVGKLTVGRIDFRSYEHGSILILEQLSGECVPVASVRARYHLDQLSQSCTDGMICLYYQGQQSWGRMSLRVAKADAACATSVIFDSAAK